MFKNCCFTQLARSSSNAFLSNPKRIAASVKLRLSLSKFFFLLFKKGPLFFKAFLFFKQVTVSQQ